MHPRLFRERFGDEMLSAFDEGARRDAAAFFVDGLASLVRQWLFRSGIWKLAVGALLTALVLGGVVHSEANSQRLQVARAAASIRPVNTLNKAEFNREVVQAVAMLARFREEDRRQSHSSHTDPSAPAENPSQD
jgi:hypothetical protein